MADIPRKGVEEARNQLPDLLEAAEKGQATVITRHGRPGAALVAGGRAGRGRAASAGYAAGGARARAWGKSRARTPRRLRDEWGG